VNPRGVSFSSSFDPNDVREVNLMISLWSSRKVDTPMWVKMVWICSAFPSSSLFLSQECGFYDVNYPSSNSPSPNDMEELKEGDSSDYVDFTPSKTSLTSCSMIFKPFSPFSNRLKRKKPQCYVDKIRKTFSQLIARFSSLMWFNK